MSARGFSLLFSLILSLGFVSAFDMTKNNNLAVYWGQGSGQKPLSFYCQDDTIDTIPIAFLYQFKGIGGQPQVDVGNACNSMFPGTSLVNCPNLANDIKTCQDKGKIVTLSLGGATGVVGFSSDSEAQGFADTVWNMFLGGSSSTRPFGQAVLDGIDLDIESGSPAHYAAFVNQLRNHFNGASKKYYVTAAPQCPFPDANIGDALNAAPFDAVYVQFYNNDCGLNHASAYNFGTWDNWAKTQSANKNVKVYIGAPGSQAAAGQGYVDASTLAKYATDAQSKYSSFGGVMLWDAVTAYNNNRYDQAIKTAMSSGKAPSVTNGSSSAASSSLAPTATHASASKKGSSAASTALAPTASQLSSDSNPAASTAVAPTASQLSGGNKPAAVAAVASAASQLPSDNNPAASTAVAPTASQLSSNSTSAASTVVAPTASQASGASCSAANLPVPTGAVSDSVAPSAALSSSGLSTGSAVSLEPTATQLGCGMNSTAVPTHTGHASHAHSHSHSHSHSHAGTGASTATDASAPTSTIGSDSMNGTASAMTSLASQPTSSGVPTNQYRRNSRLFRY